MDNNVLYFETRSRAMGFAIDLVNSIQGTELSDEDKNDILMDVVEFVNESQPN